MKKLFILLFIASALTACSDDDKSVDTTNDSIVGKWYVAEINNAEQFDLSLNDCNTESFITFKNDFTSESAFYEAEGGECKVQQTNTGTWSIEGENTYSFVIPYDDLGSQQGRVEFNGDFTSFTFFPTLLSAGTENDVNIVFEKR